MLGVALAGAGGGGFLYALLKSSESKEQIEQIVQSLNMEVYRAEISKDGIEFNHINWVQLNQFKLTFLFIIFVFIYLFSRFKLMKTPKYKRERINLRKQFEKNHAFNL